MISSFNGAQLDSVQLGDSSSVASPFILAGAVRRAYHSTLMLGATELPLMPHYGQDKPM